MTISQIEKLIERVEKATGRDPVLNKSLATAIGGYVLERRGRDRREWFYPTDREPFYRTDRAPDYTASIDAALALVERVWPGSELAIYTNWPITTGQPQNADGPWTITDSTPRGCWVRFYGASQDGPRKNADGEALTPALAVCLALLRSLQERGGKDE